MKVIKLPFLWKLRSKKNHLFCGLTFHSMQSLKTIYHQKEILMLNLIKQTVTLYVGSITSYSAFNVWVVISSEVINRMDQKLVWLSYSIDSLCVPNYKEIRRGHVNFMLIWHGMTLMYSWYWILAYFDVIHIEYLYMPKAHIGMPLKLKLPIASNSSVFTTGELSCSGLIQRKILQSGRSVELEMWGS